MATNEKTSDKIASIAAIGLKSPEKLTNAQIQKIAAVALTQAADKPKFKPATKAKPAAKPKK